MCIVYEYDLQSFHQGTEFTLGYCLLRAARSIKMLKKINKGTTVTVLDLMRVQLFHRQM